MTTRMPEPNPPERTELIRIIVARIIYEQRVALALLAKT